MTAAASFRAHGETYDFELVRDGAVIARKGPQTGAASVIRLPRWLAPEHRAAPEAQYYLYYCSDHREYIHMKWAESPIGPWYEFDLGGVVNDHSRRGVLDLATDEGIREEGLRAVASVDVHVDDETPPVVMFFHGNTQIVQTDSETVRIPIGLVATSADGLNFHDPKTAGGQPGHGPRRVTVDGVRRTLGLAPHPQRAFRHRGNWYSLSPQAAISKAPTNREPWAAASEDPGEMAWTVEDTPGSVWREESVEIQMRYISPAASFLASNEFAKHPHNPHPGGRFNSSEARIDDVSLCVLHDDRLEIFFCIHQDPQDRYDGIYRLVYDIQAPDFQDWTLHRDISGKVDFEVVLTAEEIAQAVRTVRPEADPIRYADPVSLGSPYVFIDDDGSKYLFFSYVSERYGGYEGRGQMATVRLIPAP